MSICGRGGAVVKASWIDDQEVIIKKWPKSRKNSYFNEKKTYLKLKGENYIPNFLYYDDKNLTFIIEDVGDSLRKLVRNNEYHNIPKNLHLQLEFIMRNMYNKYKLIHGDITFRNICVKNGKIYLIDFDATEEINISTFNYNNQNNYRLGLQVSLLTNYNYFCRYINKELTNIIV